MNSVPDGGPGMPARLGDFPRLGKRLSRMPAVAKIEYRPCKSLVGSAVRTASFRRFAVRTADPTRWPGPNDRKIKKTTSNERKFIHASRLAQGRTVQCPRRPREPSSWRFADASFHGVVFGD